MPKFESSMLNGMAVIAKTYIHTHTHTHTTELRLYLKKFFFFAVIDKLIPKPIQNVSIIFSKW